MAEAFISAPCEARFGLVHVIIFYTAGFATLGVLGKNTVGYVPYRLKISPSLL
jgi:hypothetical protein